MKENEQELEEFIRDICKVTPMSKSEARRRLDLIIHQAIAEERARVVGMIEKLRKVHEFKVTEVEDIAKESYNQALDDLVTSLDITNKPQ